MPSPRKLPPFVTTGSAVCIALVLAGVARSADRTKEDGAKPNDSGAVVESAGSVKDRPLSDILRMAREIDALVEADCKANNVELNAPAGDEIFLRRVYLDIAGRIPTLEEAREFLDSDDENKRSVLIDRLLDSEAYVSHHFNYWADLLRIRSRMRYGPAQPYINFVKNSLRDSVPYDQFVRELITAEGYTWDNGAAGYYLRDTGMPLDNMSNTAQVFLGTQLVCAQCHDHPFDSWTQRQYYQLAAFTYGVDTRDRRNPKFLELREMRRGGDVDRRTLQAAGQILQQLNYRVNETDRSLRLPKDYQYEDGKPGDVIEPATIFGDEVAVHDGDSPADVYARWMTSKKNPRFSVVIANRLWKRAMGRGLVEPVDDFKDGVDPSNPELMTFLAKQVVELGFDLKQYQRALFNTKTYQREVTARDVTADETYHFEGPLLRRLSAEQLWDSLVTMTIVDVDDRKGVARDYNSRYGTGPELLKKDMKEILAMADIVAKQREAQFKYFERTRDLQKDLRVAYRTQDRDRINSLREKMAEIRKEVYGQEGEMMMQRERNRQRQAFRETDPRWQGFSRDLVRASEVESPARPGHFLQQFGQSDRETIENASVEATVPQILTLLNGPVYYQLFNRNSKFAKSLNEAEQDDKLDVVFLSVMSRRPTDKERELCRDAIEEGVRSQGAMDIVWALLNTRQFMFVQ